MGIYPKKLLHMNASFIRWLHLVHKMVQLISPLIGYCEIFKMKYLCSNEKENYSYMQQHGKSWKSDVRWKNKSHKATFIQYNMIFLELNAIKMKQNVSIHLSLIKQLFTILNKHVYHTSQQLPSWAFIPEKLKLRFT